MNKTVSVIVPVYNGEQYLETSINSILAQDTDGFELLLIDDGSTDASGMICDRYAKADARVSVVHQNNTGLVGARKTGVAHANGEYVCFVDADDRIEPEVVGKMMRHTRNGPVDMVLCAYQRDDGENTSVVKNSAVNGVYEGESLKQLRARLFYTKDKAFVFGILPSVCIKLFRKQLLSEIRDRVPDSLTIGEDTAVTFPTILKAEKVVIDNDICGYHYMETAASMTRSLNTEYFRKISVLYDYLKEAFPADTPERYHEQLEDYRFYLIRTKLEEIRYKSGMTEAEQIAFLDNAAKDAGVLDHLSETAAKRFSKTDLKQLLYVEKRDWKALYRTYRLEPWKERVYAMLHPV